MGCTVEGLLGILGKIDKGVKKGKYTEKQHDKLSASAIRKCITCGKPTNKTTLSIQKYQWPKVQSRKLFG